jgi:predicted  nucleic acid-binding Zn-ribbon protein
MAWFINYYRCPDCGETWCDEWSAQCDDDCPACGARHITPYKSDDARPEPVEVLKDIAATFRRINGTAEHFSAEEKLALLQEHEDGVFAAIEESDDD